jgi:hypothetical protein
MRRMACLAPLPNIRVFLHGPRWRRTFDVKEVATALPRGGPVRLVLLYDFEADVRELVLDELRPDVFAMWSDPRERIVG